MKRRGFSFWGMSGLALISMACGRSEGTPGGVAIGCVSDAECEGWVCGRDGTCVECRRDDDCSEGEVCDRRQCRSPRDAAPMPIDEPEPEPEPTPPDPEPICEPGERRCEGGSVKLCSDDGRRLGTEEACSLSQLCVSAECVDIECVPNTKFCQGGGVWKCGADGTEAAPLVSCDADQFCLQQDEDAECSDTACYADDPMCSGGLATTCKPDGSGAKPGGDDCAALGQICYEGECRDQACTPGEKLCHHDDVYLCSAGGTDVHLLLECGDLAVCSPATGACESVVCEPGARSCADQAVIECNALGTAWLPPSIDCQATGQVCDAGTCRALVCAPNETFCQGNDVRQCDALGVSTSLRKTCNPLYYHCGPSYFDNGADCLANSCTPGAAICSGNVVTTCKADGSGPSAGGTDCGASSVCIGAVCVPKVCEPGTYFCQDGDVAYCYYSGVESFVSTSCGATQYCSDETLSCQPYFCSPGTRTCLDNTFGVCAEDGLSVSSSSQSCANAGKVCTAAGSCAQTSTDVVGEQEEVAGISTHTFVGDVILVTSPRRLTQLEANLVLPNDADLRWAVFELVDSTWVARQDRLVKDQSGNGSFSSGAMDYVLKVGTKYAVGVALASGTAAVFYEPAPWDTGHSLGLALGSVRFDYTASAYGRTSTSGVYRISITTQLP